MQSMFENAESFNGDVSKWKFETVADKQNMFKNANSFSFNGDIREWPETECILRGG